MVVVIERLSLVLGVPNNPVPPDVVVEVEVPKLKVGVAVVVVPKVNPVVVLATPKLEDAVDVGWVNVNPNKKSYYSLYILNCKEN